MATGYDPNDATRRDLDRNNDGRVDSRDGPVHGTSHTQATSAHAAPAGDPALTKEVRRDAYERGRADERARHKRNPLLTLLIALAAVFGLVLIGLWIYRGSLTEAGRDVESVAGRAAQEAREAGAEAVDESGEALQDAGRRVEREGEAAQRQPEVPAERR